MITTVRVLMDMNLNANRVIIVVFMTISQEFVVMKLLNLNQTVHRLMDFLKNV